MELGKSMNWWHRWWLRRLPVALDAARAESNEMELRRITQEQERIRRQVTVLRIEMEGRAGVDHRHDS